MNVLYLSSSLAVGGIESNLLDLALALDPEKIRPAFAHLGSRGWVADRLEERGFRVEDLGFSGVGFWSPGLARVVLRLRGLLDELGVDVLHAYNFPASVLASLATLGTGVPLISSRVQEPYRLGLFHHLAYAWVNLRARFVHYNSRTLAHLRRSQAGLGPKKVRVVPNPVRLPDRFPDPEARAELRKRWKVPGDHVVVGTVANLRPVKRPEAFVDAALRLIPRHRNVTFVLVGDGPLGKDLRDRVRRGDARDRFVFAGGMMPATPALHAMDVFVLSSRAEGCPTSIMEAMGHGLPVVATRVGGVPDLVRDGENGFLVDPLGREGEEGGSVAWGLAAAVEDLLVSPELREGMGRASREIMETEFDLDAVITQMHDLYGTA